MSWHQLTYACAEALGDRAGGWGVIEETPAIPVGWRNLLLQQVVTRIDEVVPTDEYAERRQVEARVRVMSFTPQLGGGAWHHAVVAGKDATGRPGNVFTHAVATEQLDPRVRPVDLWAAPAWLTPFGANEVRAARLHAVPAPNPPRGSGIELALAHHAATEAVLAAVTACCENDRPLVLAVATADEFVGWLTAVSRLTSHAVAARIPFTTFVRAAGLKDRVPKFEVLGVPRQDLLELLALAGADGPLVLDVAALPATRDGDLWSFEGQAWQAGERWQDAFFALAERTPDEMTATLEAMDELTAYFGAMDHLSPDWPLPLAMLKREGDEYPDKEALISDWKLGRSPAGFSDPALSVLLERGSRMGTTPVSVSAPELQPSLGTESDAVAPPGQPVSATVTTEAESQPYALKLQDVTQKARDRSAWPELTQELRRREVRLVPEELPDIGGLLMQATALVANLSPANDAVYTLMAWLPAAAPLALHAGAADDQREFFGDAALLALGVCQPQYASQRHLERVNQLLSNRDKLPMQLAGLLEKWLQRYWESQRDVSDEGDSDAVS